MSDTKDFDLYSILAVTHWLPSTALQFRTILAHLIRREVNDMPGAGMSALTIQPTCRDWLLELHPQLHEVPAPPDFHGDESAMDAWAEAQAVRLGVDRFPVEPLPVGEPLRTSLGDLLDVMAEIRGDLDDVAIIDLTKPGLGLVNPDDDQK
jgi:hypothetical protein